MNAPDNLSTGGFAAVAGAGAIPKLTLSQGATCQLGRFVFENINAGDGRTINIWNSIGVTGCTNVRSYLDYIGTIIS